MQNVLITGGIGDFIALDSFLSPEQKQQVEGVYLATKMAGPITDLLTDCPTYPNLKNVTLVQDSFPAGRTAFFSRADVIRANPHWRKELETCADLSVLVRFPACITFHGSSFTSYRLADIDCFALPKKYAAICPSSPNDRAVMQGRDLDSADWRCLEEHVDMEAVVLNLEAGDFPYRNLAGQTSLKEAVEITKGAAAYVGVDSCLSVLAAKCRMPLFIRSGNMHFYRWKHVYCAPLNCPLVAPNIGTHLTRPLSSFLPTCN